MRASVASTRTRIARGALERAVGFGRRARGGVDGCARGRRADNPHRAGDRRRASRLSRAMAWTGEGTYDVVREGGIEATRELWAVGGGELSAWTAAGYLAAHPALGAAAVLATVWIVPRAVDAAWRFLVLPGLVVFVALVALSSPEEMLGFVEGAARELAAHPEELLAAALVVAAVALGPYLLGGAIIAILLSGAAILPGFLRPVLPAEVVKEVERVDSAKNLFDSFAKDVNDKRAALKAERLAGKTSSIASAPSVNLNPFASASERRNQKNAATRVREETRRNVEKREQKRELAKRRDEFLGTR